MQINTEVCSKTDAFTSGSGRVTSTLSIVFGFAD